MVRKRNAGRMRTCLRAGLGATLVFLIPLLARPFAGEDFLLGNPWHHEAISEDAMRARGFGAQALDEVAWHADYVDSYLYNPLWWIQGGLSRYKVAMASFTDLSHVHFDDNFSGEHVRRTWRRYLSGCMAGLVWAAEHNDVSAARNILGVSLHANQDFYSHSNWIDAPERRTKTWFEYPVADRNKLAVYIGAYELPEQLGVKHHGKITPGCTVLRQGALKPMLDAGCSAFSPLHNHKICDMYDECKTGTPIQPSLFGLKVPGNVLYAAPPGINVDARWSAGIGVKVRGLTDITGDQAFDTARALAQRSSEQWLTKVEGRMNAMGFGAFWNQVKSAPTTGTKEQQYESFAKFPHQFIGAGTYPADLTKPEEEYYLRVQINTANVANAGTDSDIYLEAAGKRFLLDYMPRANPVLAYNDLERNDNQVYTVGPFTSLPTSISFYNDSADAGQVLLALGQSFVNSIKDLIDSIGSFLLSIVGGNADKVGGARKVFSPAELAAVPAAGTPFTLTVNGGDEGSYDLRCRVRKVGEFGGDDREGYRDFQVTIESLYCKTESKVDRLSNSDEPYVLSLCVPLPGAVNKRMFGPFEDVDKGETRTINYTYPTVRINKAYGMLSVPIAIWESDDESAASRTQQLNEFANQADTRTNDEERGFTDTLGAALAADWKIGSLDVYAYSRGGVLRTGSVFNQTVNKWVEGKKRVSFNLNAAGLKTRPEVDAQTLDGPMGLIRIIDPRVPLNPIPLKNPPPVRIPPPLIRLFW